MPKKPSDVEMIVADMLVENTGVHALDSGDAYGRAWQINRKRVEESGKTPLEYFQSLPYLSMQVEKVGRDIHVLITKEVFHVLTNHFGRNERCDRLENEFYRFAELPVNRWDPWPEVIEKWVKERKFLEGGHDNTYNWGSLLSQDVWYYRFFLSHDHNCYAFIMIHGGCDIRGGYTKPRLFYTNDFSSFVADATNATIQCQKCAEAWEYPTRYLDNFAQYRKKKVVHRECGGELVAI